MAENTAGGKKVVYEGMFIFDANRFGRDREGLPRDIAQLIESAGGQVEVSRLWEERRLAYPIKGQRKGTYWITYFRLSTVNLAELNKQCDLKDGVLRHLFIRLPESLVEPIIEHAKGREAKVEQETVDRDSDVDDDDDSALEEAEVSEELTAS